MLGLRHVSSGREERKPWFQGKKEKPRGSAQFSKSLDTRQVFQQPADLFKNELGFQVFQLEKLIFPF